MEKMVGGFSLSLHSVNLDLNGYLFRLPAVYSELASGNFNDARGYTLNCIQSYSAVRMR